MTKDEATAYAAFQATQFTRRGCEACVEKDQKIARLKDAAKGIGMVSEMADVEEVAVLVVGLHQRLAEVERERGGESRRASTPFLGIV
jgi:hypothetical protein